MNESCNRTLPFVTGNDKCTFRKDHSGMCGISGTLATDIVSIESLKESIINALENWPMNSSTREDLERVLTSMSADTYLTMT